MENVTEKDQPRYVLGFAFDEALEHVVLLQKRKPIESSGMWNGLGGRIELSDDTPEEAMQREFEEECGVLIPSRQWKYLGAFERPQWYVECFCVQNDDVLQAKTRELEQVKIHRVDEFMIKTITEPDLYCGLESSWLVPYARRFLLKPDAFNEFISAKMPKPEMKPRFVP